MVQERENSEVYSVSALTERIQDLLEEELYFVWVEGEISNFSSPASGHLYMALKDEKAQIRAVMFRMQARYLKFLPENGMKVIARGRVRVYAPRGNYQIILDYLEPLGAGSLALAFEQLKRKLAEQGLFAEEIKKPLPYVPQRVAVITSPTGAAIKDFLKVVHRRFANLEIVVLPVRVQGEDAAKEIISALELANRELEVDVIVLTRGGGSLEDLWAFNMEELALAIRRSEVPVVSAVGHEIDVTISDLAADFRAPTPSAAAELLVKEKETLVKRVEDLKGRLESGFRMHLKFLAHGIERLKSGLKDPRKRLADGWLRLDEIQGRIVRAMRLALGQRKTALASEVRGLRVYSPEKMLSSARQGLDLKYRALAGGMKMQMDRRKSVLSGLDKRVRDLSPLSVLERGYSITRKLPEKRVLHSAGSVEEGERVEVLLAEGEIECRVEKKVTGKQRHKAE